MDRVGAVACLCGRNNRFFIKNTAVSLGRATDTHQVCHICPGKYSGALEF